MSVTLPRETEADRDARRFTPRPNRHKESVAAKRFRAELIADVGGDPPIPARALIDRATRTKLQLDVMDRRYDKANHIMSLHDCRVYSALNNSLVKIMRELKTYRSPDPPAATPPSLADVIVAHRAASEARLDATTAAARVTAAPDDDAPPGDTETPP